MLPLAAVKIKEGAIKRTCFDCIHCDYDSGWGGTEVTPGDPAAWTCAKGRWKYGDLIERWATKTNLVPRFATATKCPEYEPEEWAT